MVPSVDYDSHEELVSAIYRGRREYALLLGRVVDKNLELSEEHLKEARFSEELGTDLGKEVRTMVTSVDCSKMRGGGAEILLRVTRGRGKWWAAGVNEEVINAVENSFHERIRNGLLWLVTFAGGRIDFGRTKKEFYLSVREEMVAEALDGILGCPYSGRFGAVFKRSFTYYVEPQNNPFEPAFYILRRRLMEYLVAFLSITHKRLGAASAGRELDCDTAHEIFKYIHFR